MGNDSTGPTLAFVEITASTSNQNPLTYRYSAGPNGWDAAGTARENSLYAIGDLVANELRVFSDERIKKEIRISDKAADLRTLKGIQVSDYKYIDYRRKGSRDVKKVIAQQVEKVYPQAVARAPDVVPDIYTHAGTEGGWVLLSTSLKAGERVRLIADHGEITTEVLEVRHDAFRPAGLPEGEQPFVYGREVPDFRTVDYDAIAMLNVSATQELARQLEVSQAELAALRQENSALKAQLATQAETDRSQNEQLAKLSKLLDRQDEVVLAK